MNDLHNSVFEKLIGMFRPYEGDRFLDFNGAEVICGPDDRSLFGSETNFPKQWLIEDFGFTSEEADYLIARVRTHRSKFTPSE